MTRRHDLIVAAANNYQGQLQQLLESSDPHMTHEAENDAVRQGKCVRISW